MCSFFVLVFSALVLDYISQSLLLGGQDLQLGPAALRGDLLLEPSALARAWA